MKAHFYYADKPLHVYDTLKRFPEVSIARKDCLQMHETNQQSVKATIARNINNSKGVKRNPNVMDTRVNSEKIFTEGQVLQSLCKSEDINGMQNIRRSILQRKLDERKNRANQQLDYLKATPLTKASLAKASVYSQSRPESAVNKSARAPSPKSSPKNAVSPVTPRGSSGLLIDTSAPPLITGIMSPPLESSVSNYSNRNNRRRQTTAVRSPFKPASISKSDLESICLKLQQTGFHFHPDSDAASSLLDCGLLTVLNGTERTATSWYIAEPSERNRLDLQSRLLLVLGVRLTDSEVSSLHSLLLRHGH